MASVRGRRTQGRLWLAFAAGCAFGGLLTGMLLGVLGGLLSPMPPLWRTGALVVLAVLLVGLDLVSARLRLPQRSVLIPRQVFTAGLARGGFRFGVEYGCGWRTLVPSAAPYLVAAFVLLVTLPVWWAALLGTVFGAARSLAVLQFLVLGRPGWQSFLSRHTRVLERAGSVLTAALVVWAAVSGQPT